MKHAMKLRMGHLGWSLCLTLAACALGLLLGGCAQLPREPLVQGPTTARAAERIALAPPQHGAIYNNARSAQALFEDRRPREVGDTLTIIVSENVSASKSSGANASRNGAASLELGGVPRILSGLLSGADKVSMGGKNTLSAGGDANASNNFEGVITVTVTDMLPNGNLRVSGEKQMLINQGTEFIRFSGVVNPRTLSAANSVVSTQVADARMEYSGKGFLDEAQTMGWLQRIFLNVLPF
jgi:flagellar L-ring protein precursor FlgH